MLIYALGLGLAISWLWLTFLNGPLLHVFAASTAYKPNYVFLCFLLSNSLAYLLVAIAGAKYFYPPQKKLFCLNSYFLVCAGTVIPFIIPDTLRILETIALILAGIGSALLICFWGGAYSVLTPAQAALSFGGAIVFSTFLLLSGSLLPKPALITLACICPPLSLACLFRSKPAEPADTSAGFTEKRYFQLLPIKLIGLILLFYTAGGLMHKLLYSFSSVSQQETFYLTNIFYSLICLAAGMLIYYFPDLDLRLLYRPVLPLLGAGFVLFPAVPPEMYSIPLLLFQAGFALFDTYTWLLFAYLAGHQPKPLPAIGWCMFALTFPMFLGDFLLTLLLPHLTVGPSHMQAISVSAAIIMFISSLIFQDRRETFAGWNIGASCSEKYPAISLNTNYETGHIAGDSPSSPDGDHTDSAKTDLFLAAFKLTPREKEIALLLLKGRNNPYIRNLLNISDNTLKTHLRNIYGKLLVTDRQELVSRYEQFK